MPLADFALALLLTGLTAYVVLAGADFGAGFWTLLAGREPEAVRRHAHRAMAPVWEANHVWLIFVLVVCWTAFPEAFASITSTLTVPLFVAGVGIILRGSTYVVRAAAGTSRVGHAADVVFALSSILTPFALGAVVGGIASGRVPVGNAEGSLVTSWLNPTSALIGAVTVVTGAYLAAVYLAADARRLRDPGLQAAFRRRALGAGVVAGALALGGLAIVRADARSLYDGLVEDGGLACVVVSAAAGIATLALVWRSRFELARATAALAVASIVAGWAVAQQPFLLPPDLTVDEAAAGRSTLVATAIVAAIAAVILVPSLGLLFSLVLRGRFDLATPGPPKTAATAGEPPAAPGLTRTAGSGFVAGAVLLVVADAGWLRGTGVAVMLASIALAFPLLALPSGEPDDR